MHRARSCTSWSRATRCATFSNRAHSTRRVNWLWIPWLRWTKWVMHCMWNIPHSRKLHLAIGCVRFVGSWSSIVQQFARACTSSRTPALAARWHRIRTRGSCTQSPTRRWASGLHSRIAHCRTDACNSSRVRTRAASIVAMCAIPTSNPVSWWSMIVLHPSIPSPASRRCKSARVSGNPPNPCLGVNYLNLFYLSRHLHCHSWQCGAQERTESLPEEPTRLHVPCDRDWEQCKVFRGQLAAGAAGQTLPRALRAQGLGIELHGSCSWSWSEHCCFRYFCL